MRQAAECYARWASDREHFLKRARDSSALTIPSLIPRQAHTSSSELPTPYQGLGAQGVNNLASKLLLSLLPPTQPFFRLLPRDPAVLSQLPAPARSEVEEELARTERVVAGELEVMAIRVKVFEALKHLIVGGNVVLHVQASGESRVIGLDQFVARRDPMGFLECLILRESLDRETLPPELAAMVQGGSATTPIPVTDATSRSDVAEKRDSVDLYTCMEWDAELKRYRLHQELAGCLVPGSPQTFPEELNPYRVLRYAAIDGEDYGRGMVEEVLGDLVSLEGLMRAIVEAAAISARILFLTDPAGAATADDLNSAPNGSFRPGRATDVTALQAQKSADLTVAFSAIQRIEERLERAFLLNSAVQRNAERVTAEEIRFVAQELESTLGGVFSVLSQELQLPVVQLVMDRLKRERRIPKFSKKSVRLAVVTGVEALGRGQELSKIGVATQATQAIVGPEQLNRYMDVRALIGAIFTAAGVDTKDLLRSKEEVQAAEQQAMIQEWIQRLGPEALKQVGPGIAQRLGLGAGAAEGAQPQPAPPATPPAS